MLNAKWINKKGRPFFIANVFILMSASLLAACSNLNLRETVMKKIVSEEENYFAPADMRGSDFTKLTDRVYTYRWTWYRNIVIDTDDGLVIVDPFNRIAAEELFDVLQNKFPGKPIHTLIYSHYHLDHVSGGEALNARRIIAHEKCPQYWQDIRAKGVAQPTLLISGDRKLTIGNVPIELLYMGKSHTDTLYSVYLPGEDLLFTADFGLIRTIPPIGGPDYYIPGALKEMERVSKLRFSIFVPSHFGYGTRNDYLEFMQFANYFRNVCREAIEKYGKAGGATFPTDAENLEKMFGHIYYPMKERYGNWHGFDEMILMAAIRQVTGAALGY